jgi:hypothetical protein
MEIIGGLSGADSGGLKRSSDCCPRQRHLALELPLLYTGMMCRAGSYLRFGGPSE